MNVSEEYAPGLWRPAVPLPYYGFLHARCECGRRFWGSTAVVRIDTHSKAFQRYERHYRAEHIKARPPREPWEHPWLPADRGGWP